MRPQLCARCKKNAAVVFVTKYDGTEAKNEGLCLKCAKELKIKPIDDMLEKMGIGDDDLDQISGEMAGAMGELGNLLGGMNPDMGGDDDDDDEEDSGKTATFPFMNRLFGGANPPEHVNPAGDEGGKEGGEKKSKGSGKKKFLDGYCLNLTARAREGKLDNMIGRQEELERVIQILNRRQKNNPCLIGEPGVGKTAIAEGLATAIAKGHVPYKLREKEVYLVDMTALVAGTQFRGQFESRMKGLIDEVKKQGNIILVIDEIHNIVGAGDAEGSMNAANIL